ncbi:MAG: hypothetical protein Q9187_000546 [Circinaria calcarea]
MSTVAKALHEQYGDAVRIAPTSLLFNTAQAWKDIYGHRPGKGQLPKDRDFYFAQKEGPSIFISNDADHSRMRRLLSHSFSERALQEQAPLINKYLDLLISQLRQRVEGCAAGKVDIVMWYNCTTFDIIGDLAFGQPFGSLEKGEYHFWIRNIFKAVKMTQMMRISNAFPVIRVYKSAMAQLYPGSSEARAKHAKYSVEATDKRLAMKTQRKDFMSYILRFNDEKGMSVAEIRQTSKVLVLAGSETTATLLSGATFYLCQNRSSLEIVTREVRDTYKSETEITLNSIAKLPYLNAVLEESLRLYPPVPSTLPRRTLPSGDTIGGYAVPGDISVGVNQWAANHTSQNFLEPEQFIPERWLDDAKYKEDKRAVLQPFSLGPRGCLGVNLAYAEMRSILSRVLWNFDMKLCEESANWTDQKTFFMWDKPGLMVQLSMREN